MLFDLTAALKAFLVCWVDSREREGKGEEEKEEVRAIYIKNRGFFRLPIAVKQ